MPISEQTKIKLIIRTFKGIGILGFIAFNGYLVYRYIHEQEAGRERAFIREKQKANKTEKKPMLPQQLQPQYIEKQRRKYQKIIKSKQGKQQL